MKDVLKGELVRLSAFDPEELGRAYANWNRDSEFTRLFDTGAARLHSAKSIKEFFEEGIEKDSLATHFFHHSRTRR